MKGGRTSCAPSWVRFLPSSVFPPLFPSNALREANIMGRQRRPHLPSLSRLHYPWHFSTRGHRPPHPSFSFKSVKAKMRPRLQYFGYLDHKISDKQCTMTQMETTEWVRTVKHKESGTRLEVARAYLVTFVNVIHAIIPTRGFELNVASVTKSAKHPTWTWGIGLDNRCSISTTAGGTCLKCFTKHHD